MHEEQKRYITDKEVAARYNIARCSVWYLVKKGKLPKPWKISDNVTRWSIKVLDAHDEKNMQG